MSASDEDVSGPDELEEEVEIAKKSYHLTKETIGQQLSLLCRTGNGLAHAFVKVDLQDKNLSNISALSSYIHLCYVDISNNCLTDLSPLAPLNQLLWLKADNNSVASFKGQPFAHLRYLQWLSLAMNHVTELDGLIAPSLETLILTGNSIQKIKLQQSVSFTNLVTLELRRNGLETIEDLNLPHLRHLFLAQNNIKCLEGLEKLERLMTLHLRDNQIDNLKGLSANMKGLQYLNIRGNKISNENALQSLRLVSQSMQTLVVSENPLGETTDYRICILVHLPRLERIDKDPVSREERADALRRIRELESISDEVLNGQNEEA
ncbi:leucine-rich repeat-containing protein 23 isoform X1 [Takifugu flavidus]|uniref:Leucine-rich repeat-containing protein 23 n=2 Tax=Takifugu TaxID=31032 RepID=A0A5C6MRE6_9TELE|nr:leucine-rich repeat-containing protein 23 isoform X1 [Takifugu flavidus]TNM87025.1 hypothetical protein fugu_007255 [Takifugu bimaculatus]TWW56731.1 Leucine-rich repeat-containing protein 23 [Takifugu flavidus]